MGLCVGLGREGERWGWRMFWWGFEGRNCWGLFEGDEMTGCWIIKGFRFGCVFSLVGSGYSGKVRIQHSE